MKQAYTYEPAGLEILLTELAGATFLQGYYTDFVRSLGVEKSDRILDYCAGGGFIAGKIAEKLRDGRLVYADVSRKWLARAAGRLSAYQTAASTLLTGLGGAIRGGGYDKIVVHYVLHDFPVSLRASVIQQCAENLKATGTLFIREPLGTKHGMMLYEAINLLEAAKTLSYHYQVTRQRLPGVYIDIKCRLKKEMI